MVNIQDAQARRQELSAFLQARRGRVKPQDWGLPEGKRRRTPGLRREEVAQLAGIGIDWYTWLEQGRDIHVSDQVLDSIAHVLRLDTEERKHLYMLAFGYHPPEPNPDHDEFVGATLRRFIADLGIMPAFILGYRWDVLAWNASAAFLFGDFASIPAPDRNILWITFTDARSRAELVDWESHAQRLVAQFRVSYGKYVSDPGFTALVDRLQSHSPEFAAYWSQQDVYPRQDAYKQYQHPAAGCLQFKQNTFLVSDAPDLKLVVHIPLPETDTAVRLERSLGQGKVVS
ncbi:MAG: helix-turn-helix transcriptional regulator [Anaerolineae bacterium]|nr:helix-turn-helix transcriptional regulator [Anaerolineae bacterium]